MSRILLSVLIPTLSPRLSKTAALVADLERRSANFPVEILWFGDNRRRTLSLKREALVKAAAGRYIVHLDDDDALAENYFERVVPLLAGDLPDVVSYNSQATINGGNPFVVRSSITFENEHSRFEEGIWYDIKRKPWHWCVWRTSIARLVQYPDITYGEDWAIVKQMLEFTKQEERLDETMHFYLHNDKETTCDGSQ